MVSSPKLRAPTSFAVGWLSVLAWGMQCAFGPSITAQIVMFLANLHYPSFEAQRWQVYLLYVAFSIFCSSIVIFFSKKIPKIEVFVFTMSLVGFVVLTIIALARSNHKQPTEVVFLDFVNITGWNDSFAFLIGVSQAMFSYLSLDSVTHMAEGKLLPPSSNVAFLQESCMTDHEHDLEIPNPGRGVPRAMGLTMLIGAVTALPYTIAVLYSSSNLAEVQVSSVPIVTIYIQIMRSTAGATFLAVWFILIFLGAEVSCIVTTSRLVWAFARDNGLPFSKTFAKVHPKFEAPINAVILTCAFFSIYGAIYIGSLSAFNSFVSLSILGLNVTYVVPQIIAFWRGRDKVLPKRYLDLGPWFGPFCNVISTAWVCVVLVVFCFPVFIPVDAASMNYVSVVTVGVVVVILAMWWGGKRKTFTGPKAILEGVPGPLAERVMNLDDSVPKTMH